MRTPFKTAAVLLIMAAMIAPSPAQSARGDAKDEAITLTEFNVVGDAADSYGASESMTGSRVAEKIKNLSYPVNIITSEFLHDFAFFELGEELAYTTSFANNISEN